MREEQADGGGALIGPRRARPGRGRGAGELLVLAGMLVLVQAAPRPVPLGIHALGLAAGAGIALHAVALLLVYRVHRFVNFAQLHIGLLAGLVFVLLVQGERLVDAARSACGGCISAQPGPLVRNVNFLVAVVVAVGAAVLASWLLSLLVGRRFAQAPRIVCSLVTVFAAQVLAGLRPLLEGLLLPAPTGTETRQDVVQLVEKRSTRPPGDFVWRIDELGQYRMGQVLTLVLVAVAAVTVSRWLGRTRAGAEVRAASERPARARTLGVDVAAVGDRVWIVSGLLAGLVGVFSSFGAVLSGVRTSEVASTTLALILVALLVARFEHVGRAALAGVVLGVIADGALHGYQSSEPLQAALVVFVGVLMLLQRDPTTRAEQEAEAAAGITAEVSPVPPELRALPQVRTWRRALGTAGAVVVLGLPWAMSASTVTSAAAFVVLVLVGLSLLVLTGWAGQLSLGQMGVAAVGAWAAAVTHLPAPFAVLVGGLAGTGAALAIGVPALRLRSVNVAIITMAFALSAPVVFAGDRLLGRWLPDSVDRPGLFGMDLHDPRVFYYVVTTLVAAACIAVVGLRRSRTGRVLIAGRSNPAALTAMGVSAFRAKLTAFAVAGFLAGTAGALLVYHEGGVRAEAFSADAGLGVFLYSVVGGLGGIAGPVLGFAFEAVVTLSSTNPVVVFAGTGLGGILLLLAAPGGLAQLVYDARDAGLRRLAVRLRIPVPSLLGRRHADRVPLREARTGVAPVVVYDVPRQWAAER